MKRRLILCILFVFSTTAGVRAQTKDAPPYKPAASADEAIQRIEDLGAIVLKVAAKSDDLEVDFRDSLVADAHLQYLQSLKSVAVVRLRETRLTDAGLVHLAKLTSLRRLHLEKTAITDAGLRHLSGLKELEQLNLFGVQIGDAGLAHLKSLPKLKSLILTDTKVTTPAILEFRKAIAGIEIVPDPALERRRANVAWQNAKEVVALEEQKLAEAQKISAELTPKAPELKKVADELRKKNDLFRKAMDDSKKKFDEALKRAKELNTPDTQQQAAVAKSAFEDAQKEFRASDIITQPAQQLSQRASNAKRIVEETQQRLDAARKLEEKAQTRISDLEVSGPNGQ